MLGGTGSINGLLYMRGSPGDYKPWEEAGYGWDWETVLKYFKKSERIIDATIINNQNLLQLHGTQGEFVIDQLNFTHTYIADKLIEAYKQIGLNYLHDLNGLTQRGVGKIRGSNYEGRRVSTATAFLNTVRERDNLFVLKKTFVTKIIFDDKKVARSVNVNLSNGKVATFHCTKEIIVSAGTINTPTLLMLSGIGPKDHLKDLGIKVVADLPVGENLQDHVRIPIPVTLNSGANKKDDKYWLRAAAEYIIDQTGPHSTNYDQPNINAFLSVSEGNQLPDVQIDHNYFVPETSYVYSMCSDVMSMTNEICKQFSDFNKDKELIIFFVALCRPFSRGNILLRTANATDPPLIHSRYFSDQRDLKTFVKGLKRVVSIVETPAMTLMNTNLERIFYKDCDDFIFSSDEYWECMAHTVTYNVYHPVGTAKMGSAEDATSVVDNLLRVHGVGRLRVVDASIMPTIPSVNTNAPTMMIAERAADFIKEQYNKLDKVKNEL